MGVIVSLCFFLFSKMEVICSIQAVFQFENSFCYPRLNPEAILVGSCSSGTIRTKIMSSDPSMFIDPLKC